MSEYNWCHGPYCHKSETLDRVRGVKGQKVLRTRKIPINTWNRETIWRLFCSQGCLMEFVNKHTRDMIALEPRFEALETPILDPKRTAHSSQGYYSNHTWYDTEIKVDETRQQ